MAKYFVRVVSFKCNNYDSDVVDNTLFLPASKSDIIDYTLGIEFKNYSGNVISNENFNNVFATFVNSKIGTKYSIGVNLLNRVNGVYYYRLVLDSQSYEDSNSDLLDISFKSNSSEAYLRLPIKVKYVKQSKRIFNYKALLTKVIDSNLLTSRTKIGFASWSTVEKNINSTTLKLLEPLHAVFSETYSKINEYLKQSFNLEYMPLKYSRVFLKNYPKLIVRLTDNGMSEELKESHDIFSSPKKLNQFMTEDPTPLYSLVYDYSKSDEFFLLSINEVLRLKQDSIYIKVLESSQALFTSCNITGLNHNNLPITETVIIRKDMYAKAQNRFIKIESVECNVPIEITNYVDLRYSHYVDSEPYITPAIVDRNLATFKPEVIIKTNHELTDNLVVVNNNLIERGLEQYKFNLKDKDLVSLYVNNSLDVVYTTTNKLHYSKLNYDYSQKIGDKTCNNNPYIEVSDSTTTAGDWCDVIVNIDRVVNDFNLRSFYLEIKNEDKTYYYNNDSNTLSEDKVHIYTELTLTDVLSFSIYVENSSAYVFSIVDEQTGIKFSSMIENYIINPYQTIDVIPDSYMILMNDTLKLTTTTNETDSVFLTNTGGSITKQTEKELAVCLKTEYANRLDFILYINEYTLSLTGSTLPENAYKLYYNRTKGLTYIYFDKRILNHLFGDNITLKLGTSYNQSYGVLPTSDIIKAKLFIKDLTSTMSETVLSPKRLVTEPTQIEYTILLNLNNVENLTITRESDYD